MKLDRTKQIGNLVIPEAKLGPSFSVTSYLSWDNGEVSGPYGNWKQTPLTVGHLLLAVDSLSLEELTAFFAEAMMKRCSNDDQGR